MIVLANLCAFSSSDPPPRRPQLGESSYLGPFGFGLFKKTKGSEAKLAYQGHVLMENRNGLVVNALLTCASGTAEREAALAMLAQRPQKKRVTVGGDKAYDTRDFVADLRACQVTPHVAQNKGTAQRDRPAHHAPSWL